MFLGNEPIGVIERHEQHDEAAQGIQSKQTFTWLTSSYGFIIHSPSIPRAESQLMGSEINQHAPLNRLPFTCLLCLLLLGSHTIDQDVAIGVPDDEQAAIVGE
jgi:hypothetical protein